eukprot:554111_1
MAKNKNTGNWTLFILIIASSCIIIISTFVEFNDLTDFQWLLNNIPTNNATTTQTINQSINIFPINRQTTNVSDIISDNNGVKCFIWYHKSIHPEIMPSIIESFLNLKQNITDFYIIIPSSASHDFIFWLNKFYQNHVMRPFNMTCILNPRGFNRFPSYNLLSKLTKNDIVILTTVYWGKITLQNAFSVIDIKNKYSLRFKYFLMFHMPIYSAKKQLNIYYKAFQNQTYYALCLTPTFKLFESNMIPIIPTYTYGSVNPNRNENFKFHCKKKNKGDKYIIIMQGADPKKRDKMLLWSILNNTIFQKRLRSYFLFKWYGFISFDEHNQIDTELFFGKYNQSLEVFNGLDSIKFSKGVSYGDIYFTMISKNTIKDYSVGAKFTSTLIYSFAMEKPVLVYEELVNVWSRVFLNVTSFLSYRNADDIVNILLRIVESDTYYDELCVSAHEMNKIIRQENTKNLQVLFN